MVVVWIWFCCVESSGFVCLGVIYLCLIDCGVWLFLGFCGLLWIDVAVCLLVVAFGLVWWRIVGLPCFMGCLGPLRPGFGLFLQC